MIHELKILPEFFCNVKNQTKKAELRFNDRNYHENDILILKEWNNGYIGNQIKVKVTNLIDSNMCEGLNKGWVMLSFQIIDD